MDIIKKIVLTTTNLTLLDKSNLLKDFVDSQVSDDYTIEQVSYYICQNPTFPLMQSFLFLDEYTLKLICYNRFSFNKNFPIDLELVKKLNDKKLVCWRDINRNLYISQESKKKLLTLI